MTTQAAARDSIDLSRRQAFFAGVAVVASAAVPAAIWPEEAQAATSAFDLKESLQTLEILREEIEGLSEICRQSAADPDGRGYDDTSDIARRWHEASDRMQTLSRDLYREQQHAIHAALASIGADGLLAF